MVASGTPSAQRCDLCAAVPEPLRYPLPALTREAMPGQSRLRDGAHLADDRRSG